jgi:hypothetical protein
MRAHISFFSGTGQGEGGADASAASICSVKISQIAQMQRSLGFLKNTGKPRTPNSSREPAWGFSL